MTDSLIPSNNSPLQHALSQLSSQQIAQIDWRVITQNHSSLHCSAEFLPFLAWENSISDAEGWIFAESETAQRQIIQNYIAKHQHKGTPAMIRQLFRDLQLGEIEIIERASEQQYNGNISFDGKHYFGGNNGDWATYGVVLSRVISIEQGEQIKQILAEIAPLRCRLLYLDFRSNPILWNGEIAFDGSYSFGSI